MENIIAQATAKQGQFLFFRNDDPIGACLHYYGEWAQQEFDLFDKILTETSNVIDVGANIGTHSVYFAKRCHRGNVISIEPQLYIFELLSANLLMNGCYNTIPIHAGAASSEGEMRMVNINPFHGEKVNYGEFKINSKTDKGIHTRLVTLDRFADLAKIDLIKLDVEGLELDVLEGSKKLLKEHKPYLYIEFNNKKGNDELLKKIYELGYIPHWHVYSKHNPDNHNKQSVNIWEPDGYIMDNDNLDLRYEGNAICIPNEPGFICNMKRIELGQSITTELIEMGLL